MRRVASLDERKALETNKEKAMTGKMLFAAAVALLELRLGSPYGAG